MFSCPNIKSDMDSNITPPYLIEADYSSLLLAWDQPHPSALTELQMASTQSETGLEADSPWESLSDHILTHIIKKKNLDAEKLYFFRVRCHDSASDPWKDFSEPSQAMRVLSSHVKQLVPPVLASRDGVGVTITWNEVAECKGYLIRYRESSPGSSAARAVQAYFIARNISEFTNDY